MENINLDRLMRIENMRGLINFFENDFHISNCYEADEIVRQALAKLSINNISSTKKIIFILSKVCEYCSPEMKQELMRTLLSFTFRIRKKTRKIKKIAEGYNLSNMLHIFNVCGEYVDTNDIRHFNYFMENVGIQQVFTDVSRNNNEDLINKVIIEVNSLSSKKILYNSRLLKYNS